MDVPKKYHQASVAEGIGGWEEYIYIAAWIQMCLQ